MGQYVLVTSTPEGQERRFELEPSRSYRLGSQPDNDIVIDQKDVSRHHAILRVFSGRFHVTDLNSKNGTYVNGKRVVSTELLPGDQLQLSSARMVVAEATADSGDPLTEDASVGTVEGDAQDTVSYQMAAGPEELVSLLETLSRAVVRGGAADPLTWAVENLGLLGALVMLKDLDGNVGVVTSAGDLGDLLTNSEVLAGLAETPKDAEMDEPRLREVRDLGDPVLVCSLQTSHFLVLRLAGSAPCVTDIRALMAATETVMRVLAASRGGRGSVADVARTPDESIPGDRTRLPPEPAELLRMELADAREAVERWMIGKILDECDGNQARASRRLGMSRAGLFKKIRKLQLDH